MTCFEIPRNAESDAIEPLGIAGDCLSQCFQRKAAQRMAFLAGCGKPSRRIWPQGATYLVHHQEPPRMIYSSIFDAMVKTPTRLTIPWFRQRRTVGTGRHGAHPHHDQKGASDRNAREGGGRGWHRPSSHGHHQQEGRRCRQAPLSPHVMATDGMDGEALSSRHLSRVTVGEAMIFVAAVRRVVSSPTHESALSHTHTFSVLR